MTCPTCHNPADSLRSVVHNGMILDGCDACLGSQISHDQNDIAKYNRQRDFEDHRQDLVQPFEGRDYIKARGIDMAREKGFPDEAIRQLY